MKGINKTLYSFLENYIEDLNYTKADNLKKNIQKFLDLNLTKFTERQELASKIAKDILDRHGKKDLFDILYELAELESRLMDIQRAKSPGSTEIESINVKLPEPSTE